MLKTFAKHFSCIVPILQSLCQHEVCCAARTSFPFSAQEKREVGREQDDCREEQKTFKIKRFFFFLEGSLLFMPLSHFSLHRLSPSTSDQFSLPRSNFSSPNTFSFLPSLSLFLPPSSPPPPCCDQSAALFSCANTKTLQLGALLLLLFLLRTRKCFWLLCDKFDNNKRAFQLTSGWSLTKTESVDLRGSLIDFQGFLENNNHFWATLWSRAGFYCSWNQTHKNTNNCFHEMKLKFKDFLCTKKSCSSQTEHTKL